MHRISWTVALGLSLIILSAILYAIHYLIFRDAHHIFLYLLGDVAFLPIEVFLVTVVVHQLLSEREKRTMLKKLNMVIGAFFSEVGTRLLRGFVAIDSAAEGKRERLAAAGARPERNVKDLVTFFRGCEYRVEPGSRDLEEP